MGLMYQLGKGVGKGVGTGLEFLNNVRLVGTALALGLYYGGERSEDPWFEDPIHHGDRDFGGRISTAYNMEDLGEALEREFQDEPVSFHVNDFRFDVLKGENRMKHQAIVKDPLIISGSGRLVYDGRISPQEELAERCLDEYDNPIEQNEEYLSGIMELAERGVDLEGDEAA